MKKPRMVKQALSLVPPGTAPVGPQPKEPPRMTLTSERDVAGLLRSVGLCQEGMTVSGNLQFSGVLAACDSMIRHLWNYIDQAKRDAAAAASEKPAEKKESEAPAAAKKA